jgi:hypothetical protein
VNPVDAKNEIVLPLKSGVSPVLQFMQCLIIRVVFAEKPDSLAVVAVSMMLKYTISTLWPLPLMPAKDGSSCATLEGEEMAAQSISKSASDKVLPELQCLLVMTRSPSRLDGEIVGARELSSPEE